MRRASDNRALLMVVLAVWLASFASCQGDRGSGGDDSSFRGDSRSAGGAGSGNDDLDLGQGYVDALDGPRKAGTAASTTGGAVWTIVLKTFTHEEHASAAATMLGQLTSIDPLLSDAWVHTSSKGSAVVLGRYPSVEAGRSDLERVKAVTVRQRAAFPRAYLSRVRTSPTADRPASSLALMNARRKHPDVHPLYTLDVAVWYDFDSGTLTVDEIQERAEAYARQLRSEGVEAYVHHDADRKMSTVTIGLFDRTAYDHESGIFSPEVEAILRRFPERLNNGEPLLIPVDPRRPDGRAVPQGPRLVEVPGS